MEDQQTAMRKSWFPRLSLLTAILLMTIAGMAMVIWQLSRELVLLRADNRQFRKELGSLSIDDENKIYAMQVPAADPMSDVSRYRIYLPANRKFILYSRWLTVPGRDANVSRQQWLDSLRQWKSGGFAPIESGEFTIDLQFRKKPMAESQFELISRRLGKPANMEGAVMPQLGEARGWTISSEAPRGEQKAINPADGIVLFALRDAGVTGTGASRRPTKPDETKEFPGLILWIQEDPQATTTTKTSAP
jgi:hypothetical protein